MNIIKYLTDMGCSLEGSPGSNYLSYGSQDDVNITICGNDTFELPTENSKIGIGIYNGSDDYKGSISIDAGENSFNILRVILIPLMRAIETPEIYGSILK